MERPTIDPALGLELKRERTLSRSDASVSIIIPAHNEEATIGEVVSEARRALVVLDVAGDVTVSASACSDATAHIAARAGAHVVDAPKGKGAAIITGLKATTGDVVCLIDGDLQYYGDQPLAALVTEPILNGIADAVVSDLYWRPLYPQLWLQAFFAPVAGFLFPEMLSRVGSSPWSGQRAAMRHLWPTELPEGFTSDLAILLHWNEHAKTLRPVLSDDWVNPQRPKPDLMHQELELLISEALRRGRIGQAEVQPLLDWYEDAHALMATYQPERDDPQEFEREVLGKSRRALYQHLANHAAGQ
ncbi:glycosyltransferase [Actinomadura rupiterrae]|uniref:glycosyltransferase n=1 Tax=Actinomadura rupiterrae TaxID=559627 RepID=UPI0020A53E35|nr:glycosyltransferase [Actinomadura rupiterrae]MCP2343376.1 glycosyltransferase involved in cell wall biosynthesis [Actinomadura rupiterrae]